jgi:arginyl-tRNA--protein-N-Asp/Glu arginylyltransferase
MNSEDGVQTLVRGQPNSELEIEGTDAACSYIPGQTSRMTYRLAYQLSESRYEHLLAHGWRRFGRTLFRPNCRLCAACQSLRVVIPEFLPSKSQRRNLRKNDRVTLQIVRPSVTREHLQLHHDYHLDMHQRRNWPFRRITADEYADSFLDGEFSFSREFQYRSAGRLIGLGLVDVTANAMSSVYFFHSPEWRDAALGTFSVLKEIEDGNQHGRRWLYMGYYIRDCGSMNYKNRFCPHEILQAFVGDDEVPSWKRVVLDEPQE